METNSGHYIDKHFFDVTFRSSFAFHDANGAVICMLAKGACPQNITCYASRPVAAALESMAIEKNADNGYTPSLDDLSPNYLTKKGCIVHFTSTEIEKWKHVGRLADHVDRIYQELAPKHWKHQHSSVPDVERIRRTAFSTMTVIENLREEKHVETESFSGGLHALAVLCGDYRGRCLGFPDFGFCVDVQPSDLFLFNPRVFHCETEVESHYPQQSFRRLCVFSFQPGLADQKVIPERHPKTNSHHEHNEVKQDKTAFTRCLNPASILLCHTQSHGTPSLVEKVKSLEQWMEINRSVWDCYKPALSDRSEESLEIEEASQTDKIGKKRLSFKALVEAKTDYLEDLSLLNIPNHVIATWKKRKTIILNQIRAIRTASTSYEQDRTSEPLVDSFTSFCEVAKSVLASITDDETISKSSWFNFSILLAFHVHSEYHKAFGGRFRDFSMDKLAKKFVNYNNNDYTSDCETLKDLDVSSGHDDKMRRQEAVLASEYGGFTDENQVRASTGRSAIEKFSMQQKDDAATGKAESDKCKNRLTVLLLERATGGEVAPSPEVTLRKTEFQRLKRCYLAQRAFQYRQNAQWESTSDVEVVRVDITRLDELETRPGSFDAIFLLHGWRYLSLLTRSAIFRRLQEMKCPIFLHSYVSEDPMHYLLPSAVRRRYLGSKRRLYSQITQTEANKNLLTTAKWCEFFPDTGLRVIGTFRMKGAVMGDTFFVVVPSTTWDAEE